MTTSLAARYREIQTRIRLTAESAGLAHVPVLIAVSKTFPIEKIEALHALGHRDFGENYAQELLEKDREARELGLEGIRWHLIGHLQTNKVKAVLPLVHAIHSVDSLKLGEEISKRLSERSEPLRIFLEVNIDHQGTKTGVEPEDGPELCRRLASLKGIRLEGLMCVPAPAHGADGSAFRELRELERKCRPATHGGLSMGMSQDFERAIAEGATHLRLGTAIFGDRPPH